MKDFIKIKNGVGDIESTYLYEYYTKVKSGEIHACIEMKLELERLMEDLRSNEYIYDTTKSYIYIDFIENCIKTTANRFYGKPMKLILWQKTFIELIYSFKMLNFAGDKWIERFTEVLLLIARKNGKSELIAAILTTELFFCPKGSTIICSGMTADLCRLCFDKINTMRLFIDEKQAITWLNQKGLRFKQNNTWIKMLSEKTKGREGRDINIAGIDEIHELLANEIYNPIVQSVSVNEEYKVFLFSSEGMVIDGFLDDKLSDYIAICKGEDSSDSSKRKLPFIFKQDSESEVWDTNAKGVNPLWEKANPSVGYIKTWNYLKGKVDEARTKMTERSFVLCKDFNLKQSNTASWLLPEYYNYDGSFNYELLKNKKCVGAVDLSEITDLTSVKLIFLHGKEKLILSHYWIPQSKLDSSDDKEAGAEYLEWAKAGYMTICDGNNNKLNLVADWIFEQSKKYGFMVHKIGYDQKFKQEFLSRCEFYGWNDKEELIVINQSADTLHNANKQVEADLMEHLVLGLNEPDKWCLANASLKTDGRGKTLIVKQKRQKRIDGAVTLSIGYEMISRCKNELM